MMIEQPRRARGHELLLVIASLLYSFAATIPWLVTWAAISPFAGVPNAINNPTFWWLLAISLSGCGFICAGFIFACRAFARYSTKTMFTAYALPTYWLVLAAVVFYPYYQAGDQILAR